MQDCFCHNALCCTLALWWWWSCVHQGSGLVLGCASYSISPIPDLALQALRLQCVVCSYICTTRPYSSTENLYVHLEISVTWSLNCKLSNSSTLQIIVYSVLKASRRQGTAFTNVCRTFPWYCSSEVSSICFPFSFPFLSLPLRFESRPDRVFPLSRFTSDGMETIMTHRLFDCERGVLIAIVGFGRRKISVGWTMPFSFWFGFAMVTASSW